MVVARLMGLDAAWASSSTAKPGWWLEAWARRLAADQLPADLEDELVAWLADVAALLAEHDAHAALLHGVEVGPQATERQRLGAWLREVSAVDADGAELERRIARVMALSGERAASATAVGELARTGAAPGSAR